MSNVTPDDLRKLQALMSHLSDRIEPLLPARAGMVLFLYTLDGGPDQEIAYVDDGKASRDDIRAMLRLFLKRGE